MCAMTECMMCNGWTRDEFLDQQRALIDQHGWSVVWVAGERRLPSFAYTVGLSRWDHPELLVSALVSAEAMRVLNALGEAVRAGTRFRPGERAHLPDWHTLQFLDVRDPRCMVVAQELLGAPSVTVSGLQVAWADHDGRWPWDPALRWKRGTQRLYGEPVACTCGSSAVH